MAEPTVTKGADASTLKIDWEKMFNTE
jgi:hypothetical protein